MSDHLVLYINRAADNFHWCWLDSASNPLLERADSGSLEELQQVLGAGTHQAWLLVPGTKVITRELDYNEKEKKHLRNLLPFQLEDTVIGDVDRFHFALGPLAKGRVSIAYMEKAWLENVFAQLSSIGVEVTRCWSAPLTLPLVTPVVPIAKKGEEERPAIANDAWTLQLSEGVVMVRHALQQGFSVDLSRARIALEMLLTAQDRVDDLPQITLRATSPEELAQLQELLPPALEAQVVKAVLVDFWQLDYSGSSIDLCQADFSQRLPIERWWRVWRAVAVFAGVCLGIHLAVLLYQIQVLKNENLDIRRQMEVVYRQVVPQGALVDAEKQLTGIARGLQPVGDTKRVTELLSEVLPTMASESAIEIKSIQYTADTREININLQANAFNAIEQLRSKIEQQGMQAELLSASAQGELHSARLKVSKL